MAKLPARPNLDHLRKQAKTLLAALKHGDAAAARLFIKHLPAARGLSPAKARAAGYRLADAQSAIARQSGFDGWTALARHVEQLSRLEGEWRFVGLQVDGTDMPAAMTTASRLLMDGDRFRMESPEANYDGVFTIDAAAEPMHIDIEFVEGPEAGNWSYGIFELDGDQLTICLGLTGASRPAGFSTSPGSGHALERLRRASAKRPARVTGGTRAAAGEPKAGPHDVPGGPQTGPPYVPKAGPADVGGPQTGPPYVQPADFDVPMTALLRRLEGEWSAVELVRDGITMPPEWLSFGSRAATGNEVKVVFGGQVMVHAKVKIDERATPIAVDYLNLGGAAKGKVSLGIMDWVGEDARFLINVPGLPRPSSFPAAPGKGQTLSRWRKRAATRPVQ